MWQKNFIFLLSFLCSTAFAVEQDNYFVTHFTSDNSPATLQRGARIYFNFCSGCHSLSYIRYKQLAAGIGIQNAQGEVYSDLVQKNLLFSPQDINQTITAAMTEEDAQKWFGTAAPDLSNIINAHDAAWLYNFLRAFYRDPTRPTGSNNLISPNTAMPNVLLPLRGETEAIFNNSPQDLQHFNRFITTKAGMMKPLEFDRAMADLTNFLSYVAEPEKTQRLWIGVAVLVFLSILLLFAIMLYKSSKENL